MTIKEALDIVDDLITCEMEFSDYENKELQEAWNRIIEEVTIWQHYYHKTILNLQRGIN